MIVTELVLTAALRTVTPVFAAMFTDVRLSPVIVCWEVPAPAPVFQPPQAPPGLIVHLITVLLSEPCEAPRV